MCNALPKVNSTNPMNSDPRPPWSSGATAASCWRAQHWNQRLRWPHAGWSPWAICVHQRLWPTKSHCGFRLSWSQKGKQYDHPNSFNSTQSHCRPKNQSSQRLTTKVRCWSNHRPFEKRPQIEPKLLQRRRRRSLQRALGRRSYQLCKVDATD